MNLFDNYRWHFRIFITIVFSLLYMSTYTTISISVIEPLLTSYDNLLKGFIYYINDLGIKSKNGNYIALFILHLLAVILIEKLTQFSLFLLERIYYSLNAMIVYPLLIIPFLVSLLAYYFTMTLYIDAIHFSSQWSELIAVGFGCVMAMFISFASTVWGFDDGVAKKTYDKAPPYGELELKEFYDIPTVDFTRANLAEANSLEKYFFEKIEKTAHSLRKFEVKFSHAKHSDVLYSVEISSNKVFVGFTTGFIEQLKTPQNLVKYVISDIYKISWFSAKNWSSALLSPALLKDLYELFNEPPTISTYDVYETNASTGMSYYRGQETKSHGSGRWILVLVILVLAAPICVTSILQGLIHKLLGVFESRKIKKVLSDIDKTGSDVANNESQFAET